VLRFALLICLMSVDFAFADQRSADVVTSFRTFCMPGPPDFAAIDARATAMNLSVRKDVGTARQPGKFSHSKSWLVSLDSGSHELVAGEGRGSNGEIASCGVGAEDVDGEEMRKEVMNALKVGPPLRQTASADGTQRMTVWKYTDDTTLLLADGTPMKIPGMYLTLLRQTNTSR
jgi:hypothetical protein